MQVKRERDGSAEEQSSRNGARNAIDIHGGQRMSMVVQSDQEKRAKLPIYRAVVQCSRRRAPVNTCQAQATIQGFNKGPNAARVLHQGHLASANSTSPAKTGTGTIGLAVAGDAIKRGRFIDHGFRLRCSVGRCCKAVLRAQRSIDRTHHLLSFAASNSISTYPLFEDRTVDPPPGN